MNANDYPWVVFPHNLKAGVKQPRSNKQPVQPLTERDRRNIAVLTLAGVGLVDNLELIDVPGIGRVVLDTNDDGKFLKFRLLGEEGE